MSESEQSKHSPRRVVRRRFRRTANASAPIAGTNWVAGESAQSGHTIIDDTLNDGSRLSREPSWRVGSGGTRPPADPAAPSAATNGSSALVLADNPYAHALPPFLNVHPADHESPPASSLIMVHAPNSLAAQQFRTLRYRIEQEPDAQIISVISPRDGEGKSVTAANLALALAEGGRVKVLLVDAALRRPAQAALFGIREEFGLTSVLRSRHEDPDGPIDVMCIANSLYLLPAGPKVGSAHAALASEAAAHLLGALRRSFRYILIDSSSVFGSAETLAWHGMIDRYVMVAKRGVTDTDELSRAAARLNREKILGVTFVGAPARTIRS